MSISHARAYTLQEVAGSFTTFNYDTAPIVAGKYHTVLYELPLSDNRPPAPHNSLQKFHWNDDYVRMPYSEMNLFPVKNEQGEDILLPRWEVIQTSLLKPITSAEDLELAIGSYNTNLPKLLALTRFLDEVLGDDESEYFFNSLLPNIINLALRLPDIVPGNIPLLVSGKYHSLSISQLQVACLLANCFLCIFPWKRDMAEGFMNPNFIGLFTADSRESRRSCIAEKLKSIMHYFQRVIDETPMGVITFKRKSLIRKQLPRWDRLENKLGKVKVHITDTGTIEKGDGMLQIDFANKFIGGGVIGYGCVQEEIRFIICPELLVSRLFVERLGDLEALEVTGPEQYSIYSGYGDTFTWAGKYKDKTPFDSNRRRKIAIVAIDAIHFRKPIDQFNSSAILREVNKAYVGFCSRSCRDSKGQAVASGNWGCGAFRGNHHLKFLIQLLACGASNRDLVYYTFAEPNLSKSLSDIYEFVSANSITTEQMWRILCRFISEHRPIKDFPFPYLQDAYKHLKQSNSNETPSLKPFMKHTEKQVVTIQKHHSHINNNTVDTQPSTSQNHSTPQKSAEQKSPTKNACNNSSPDTFKIPKRLRTQTEDAENGENSTKVLDLFTLMDGGERIEVHSKDERRNSLCVFDQPAKMVVSPSEEKMEVVEEVVVERVPVKKKITDYFTKS